MVHVCYMFRQHVTYLKPFVQGRLRAVVLYGYMFFENPFFMRHSTKVPPPCHEARTSGGRRCRLRGSKVRPSKGGSWGYLLFQ